MKDLKDLNRYQKIILSACCRANKYSLGSHRSIEIIRKKIKPEYHKYLKKAIKTLVSNGFLIQHPTGRKTTYELSPKGLNACNLINNDLNKDI